MSVIQQNTIPLNEFKKQMISFNVWRSELNTIFSDSTDESLKMIYGTHGKSLYELYMICEVYRNLNSK